MREKYAGVIPAFYACYDGRGTVNKEQTAALAEYFLDKKVKGIYVNGSSGECIYQSPAERKKTLEAVMDAVGGKMTVIAHVACNNTADSMELAAHAESLGVDAVAAIPPIYFRLPEHAVADYWNSISAAAPRTDFIIYNIPQLAGTALTPQLLKTMLRNERVIGVKNSSMPVQDIEIFKSAAERECIIFNGADEQFAGGRAMGADGGIGGTYGVMPELFLEMDRMIAQGRIEEAGNIQYQVNHIIRVLNSSRASMYAVIKEVLRINEDLDIGDVRAPLPLLDETGRSAAVSAARLIRQAVSRIRRK